ncbi:hypothetical protein Ae406Ps2_3009c [Pseudonocardia sp. Ae406_Ps2]|uniref:hypothetical protein n=1 Tax=unclassified Pseudonocardia TaxID=2619320 RepID=UPI00094B6DD3|nr:MULTISPECIES: hypothetical protein [unclassified Pseudonocardia]OLL99251.1 hypothetical protein Ae331Ps2_2918 [Pseudonocardia sp. Ae331_Ps2]OLM03009.1 hypothetical protein Ae406Ps2_3009c [Pseudonocardia sp. Ae406_Ps2]OLM12137.1 hypothetical protein Ae505Ps2_2264 [Pseudonocardia sp. Ae505_Ps2]
MTTTHDTHSALCTDPTHCGGSTGSAGPVLHPVVAAADLLFEMRHHLTPDVIRTLAEVWTCASAARYGAPQERFWEPDTAGDPFADHDTFSCEDEDENRPPAPVPAGIRVHTCYTANCTVCGSAADVDADYTPHFPTRAAAVSYWTDMQDWSVGPAGMRCPTCTDAADDAKEPDAAGGRR